MEFELLLLVGRGAQPHQEEIRVVAAGEGLALATHLQHQKPGGKFTGEGDRHHLPLDHQTAAARAQASVDTALQSADGAKIPAGGLLDGDAQARAWRRARVRGA